MSRRKTAAFSQKAALCAMLMMLSVSGFVMLGFMLGVKMSAASAVVPIALIALYAVLFDRKMLRALAFNLVILILWAIICSKFFDWSYDGMYYHKQAIITLAEGWNPLRESSLSANALNSHMQLDLWLDNYPKGLWICSAAMYIATGYLETSKAVNILFIVMLAGISFDTLRSVFNASRPRAVFFTAVICANPVFVDQILTGYNDLAVGALVIAAALLGMKIYSGHANRRDYALLFCVTAMSCLIKFTAPLLVGLVLIAYGIGYAVKLYRGGEDIPRRFKRPAVFILCGFLIGTAFLGFDPYMKHMLEGRNIVYPVMGEGKADIMNANPPAGFDGKPEAAKYFLSLASRTSNSADEPYRLKIPFTVYPDEVECLSNADTRLGGFGVLFSGVFVLAVITSAAAFVMRRKIRPEAAILLITFFALGLLFPEAWWARYASYTYYIPVFLALSAAETGGVKPFALAAAFLLLINSAVSAVCVIRDGARITAGLNAALDDIKAQNRRVEVRLNDFPAHIKLFEEKGIDFIVADESIPDAIVLYGDTKYRFID